MKIITEWEFDASELDYLRKLIGKQDITEADIQDYFYGIVGRISELPHKELSTKAGNGVPNPEKLAKYNAEQRASYMRGWNQAGHILRKNKS